MQRALEAIPGRTLGATPQNQSPLTKQAVASGMDAIKAQVQACHSRFTPFGTATVKMRIESDGSVSSATVTGVFADSPTGACIERAVKLARFPPSQGLTTTYPVKLGGR